MTVNSNQFEVVEHNFVSLTYANQYSWWNFRPKMPNYNIPQCITSQLASSRMSRHDDAAFLNAYCIFNTRVEQIHIFSQNCYRLFTYVLNESNDFLPKMVYICRYDTYTYVTINHFLRAPKVAHVGKIIYLRESYIDIASSHKVLNEFWLKCSPLMGAIFA